MTLNQFRFHLRDSLGRIKRDETGRFITKHNAITLQNKL